MSTGGVEHGTDAAEFILFGANTVQVCTGVMLHGYPLVKTLCAELQGFMMEHGFNSVEEFRCAAASPSYPSPPLQGH